MLINIVSLTLFIIPLSVGTNLNITTSEKLDHHHNTTASNVAEQELKNTSKQGNKILSEGGPSITPSLSLPINDTRTDSIVYNEHGKGETKSKITARKGVDHVENKSAPILKQNETDAQIASAVHALQKTIPIIVKNNTRERENISQVPKKLTTATEIRPEKVKIPKKPLILSATELENMPDVKIDDIRLPIVHSSSKSLVSDQMPAPSQKSGPTTKIEPMSTSRHPGMVIPVVITILVVPMFAILGFMAIKRGKEAWKNRHYKRMDFLLDGMYND